MSSTTSSTSTSMSTMPGANNAAAALPYPALHGQHVKIGRQTNAKTAPGERNGYFDSKVLSRQHAEVWEEGGKIFIKDVKSSNGTFINGDRLSSEAVESEPCELKSDDIVKLTSLRIGKDLIFSGIQSYISNNTTNQTQSRGFHFTMTYFWIQLVHFGIRNLPEAIAPAIGSSTYPSSDDFFRFLLVNPHLSDGGLWMDYYSKEVIMSTEAKRFWGALKLMVKVLLTGSLHSLKVSFSTQLPVLPTTCSIDAAVNLEDTYDDQEFGAMMVCSWFLVTKLNPATRSSTFYRKTDTPAMFLPSSFPPIASAAKPVMQSAEALPLVGLGLTQPLMRQARLSFNPAPLLLSISPWLESQPRLSTLSLVIIERDTP
ncbi:hypothetical protein NMY22_g15384 [Coprinellus aureogranulatus]|nr:hypothetical protein NMY22_g15384 [Coprinellus aureogranulatus]